MPDKDKKHPDLASRIHYVMDTEGWNKSQFGREVGATAGAVGNWLRRNQTMDARYAFVLQDKHRWNARWLLEGKLPARIEVTDAEAEALFREIMELPAERRRALKLLLGST